MSSVMAAENSRRSRLATPPFVSQDFGTRERFKENRKTALAGWQLVAWIDEILVNWDPFAFI